ncbi:MAG: penicillin-binding protein 2, partial [Psychromonas sp.]
MRRTLVIFIAIVIAIGVLISNLYYLQITSFQKYQTRSNDNRISVQTIPPNRGLIYDRNGIIIAENRPVYNLQVIVNKTENLDDNMLELQKLLALTDQEIENFHQQNRYARSFKAIIIRQQLSAKEVALFSVNQHRFKGFSIQA